MWRQVDRLGQRVVSAAGAYLGLWFLLYGALKGLFIERRHGLRFVVRTIAMQIYFTAVQPLPIFLATALIFGFVVIVATDLLLPQYGLQKLVPTLVAVSLTREVGPLVIAMILIGRSGTSIATELGYMKINREIEALTTAGVNLDYYLVLPRVIGVTIATCQLVLLFVATAIVGGFVLGKVVGILSVQLLFGELAGAVTLQSIAYGLTKAFIFGAVISLSNCLQGLAVEGSYTSLPRANAAGVVQSFLICFLVNALISVYAIL